MFSCCIVQLQDLLYILPNAPIKQGFLSFIADANIRQAHHFHLNCIIRWLIRQIYIKNDNSAIPPQKNCPSYPTDWVSPQRPAGRWVEELTGQEVDGTGAGQLIGASRGVYLRFSGL